MSSQDLSALEMKVMLVVMRQHPDAYGISIQQHLEGESDKGCSLASIYSALSRLEAKGFVSPRLGESTAERGGRRKTFFELTAPGHAALHESLDILRRLRRGVRLKGATA